ncbi:MAG: IS21 family transposase [Mycobacterium sp.]|nr:IS21 family transposase [Mycobacterium sp.]MBV8292604.1 IS21 family transposase [Mycobacterium sp.]
MLAVEDWAEIRRLHRAEKLSINEIVRRTGVARNTVRAALRSDTPPEYRRQRRGSALDVFEPDIRRLLMAWPRMPATVIAERIGWTRSISVLKERVHELRPLFLPPDPAGRTEYRPGELAQWDLWFPAVDIPVGPAQTARLPVIVGVSGYSRVAVARMIPSRQAHDILGGHLACLLELGAVPRAGVYDNEAALVHRVDGRPKLTEPFQRFRGTLGMGVIVCDPGDPEAKGLVERFNGYLETSFLPGRRFCSPHDFNAQLGDWLPRANRRMHATLRCRPIDRLGEDRAAMMNLTPVLPDPALRLATRLGRDHWVRVGTCDYSVHPKAIGRSVEIRVDLEEITITCAGETVGRHLRSWARHLVVTDPDHDTAGKALRAARAGLSGAAVDDGEVEQRDLSVYDEATAS